MFEARILQADPQEDHRSHAQLVNDANLECHAEMGIFLGEWDGCLLAMDTLMGLSWASSTYILAQNHPFRKSRLTLSSSLKFGSLV